ncbi:Protein methyltransferase HemK (Protein-glutamine N-methyltransferase hemK) (Protein-(glutamine-N5) MTase hemK) [Candidatus Glomeribacter gigasporarum BEG34]|uniref:Release factor glutamine methyltransferase n=1 Tax=Candidatus Glomeribacter gigasporarum BEG34 TaxID=1070319 RepID=G2J8P8_9BURK|nr:peptide chain release factor N(5)-glutamine methyltransferase [Candidatus Glomeribacter gigasporarum]CCD29145.1 Protein methyltransferase HemK (Protein-glutamine N-methyltransferase hemK) (Protein-(glutamine-N5) MTase hemK) [Candidatus Glomeribacter gigasporarum BEG34]
MNKGVTADDLLRASALEAMEARILLAHALGWRRTELMTRAHEKLEPTQADTFRRLEQRRDHGEPMAYLVGKREFFGLDFQITPDVLIPRPETELLVECALHAIEMIEAPRVLDLGTGSGVIAVAIASQRPEASIIATDDSHRALALAALNAQRLLSGARRGGALRFIAGVWYQALTGLNIQFDVIVSNPPYLAADDPHLCKGDLRFEPRSALTDSAHGLTALETVIAGAHRYLKKGGALWLEHGYDQADAVRAALFAQGFTRIRSTRDLAGIERVSGGVHERLFGFLE